MKRRWLIIAVAAAVGLPILVRAFWGQSFDSALGGAAAPAAWPGRFGNSLRSLVAGRPAATEQDWVLVRSEIDRLTVENARLRHLESENRELRETLSFAQRARFALIQANVIGHAVDPERNAIIIDRGADDGLAAGLAASAGDGLLLGIVSEVSARRAVIILLTDNRSRLAVLIEGQERVRGVLEGGYGTGARMRLIPAQADIKTGDTVVTSDLEPSVPSGLVVGTVESVRDEENIPFQVAVVRPSADIETPTTVSVVKPTDL